MAKSPKKEQGNGKKFQNRLPGEKRNRKVDADKPEPKKTKFYTDSKPGASGVDKPRFESRGGDANERPRFSSGENRSDKPKFGSDNRGGDRPRFGGDTRGGDRTDRPRFGGDNRGGDRSEKPRFGGDKPAFGARDRGTERPKFGGTDRGTDRPKFGGDNKFGDRGDKPRFGADSRGGDRPKFGGTGNSNDRPKFGNTSRSFPDKNRAPFGGSPRGSFKKRGEGFTGGDRNGNPRFAGDRSDRPKFGGSENSPAPRSGDRPAFNREGGFDKPRPSTSYKGNDAPKFGDRGDKPRFGADNKGVDRPRFGGDNRGGDRSEKPRFGGDKPSFGPRDRGTDRPKFGGADRGSDRPKFGGDRGTGKPKFEREERQFDKPRTELNDTFESAEKFNKPKVAPGAGLSKFKPIGSEPAAPKREYNEPTEQKRTQYSDDEKPKTFGIPKADKADTPVAFKGSKREFHRVVSNLEKSANHAKSDEIRLNRYIANSGICSRREADDLITQGLVKVNGDVVKELGTKIRPSDNVKVEDRKVIPEKPVYIIMNKPKGYITTTDDPEGRKTVMELIDLPGKERIYPIGRLDRNTTGVLLLTNDGEMSQKLMHPSFEIKKVYRATLDKKPSKDHMLQLVEGIELEDGMMAFEQCGFVEEGKENVLGIEIKSGRNRIVRRMFEHFGYEVTALDRVLLGEFDKVKLGRGKWRFLTEKEMNYVDRLKRTKPKAIKA
jgi:23S rRNA pseudouridine2605 synthase